MQGFIDCRCYLAVDLRGFGKGLSRLAFSLLCLCLRGFGCRNCLFRLVHRVERRLHRACRMLLRLSGNGCCRIGYCIGSGQCFFLYVVQHFLIE